MKQSYKIYLNNVVVVLTQDQQVFHIPKMMKAAIIYPCIDKKDVKNVIEKIQQGILLHNVILSHSNLKWLKDTFFGYFKIIKAGGGLAKNEKKEILMIFRKGKWDLPKGKIEKNEDIREGAIREVEEETGIEVGKVKKKIVKTYHTYRLKGNWILKETHWYAMKTLGNKPLVPQTEEDIEKVEWVNKKDAKKRLKNSYSSILDVFELI